MPATRVTVDGIPVPVSVAGPEKGRSSSCWVQRNMRSRLTSRVSVHRTASIRTVVIGPDPKLAPKSVMGILDSLEVRWGVVVGDRARRALGARSDTSRQVHRTGRDRPRASTSSDQDGVIIDEQCPAVRSTRQRSSAPGPRIVAPSQPAFRLATSVRRIHQQAQRG